ncbi:MAG: hypothetical protein ACRDMH_17830 [Solirubrobacterales bacterium]
MGSTPQQRIWRDRVEALIALAAPALDLVLSAGDRVSRVLAPEDRDYYPIRPPGEAFELDAARPRRSEPVD